jgi:N-acetylglucosaminyldiphosphoundecaprenol N-acetyl-beta-D-mannosaminyltransferase
MSTYPSYSTLGVRVDAVQIPDVIAQMEKWIDRRDGCHSIAVTGMHGVMEAQHNAAFKQVLNGADLIVPDGMPLVWLARLRGQPLERRVYGPELMATFCKDTATKGYRHYFLGGEPGVSERLEKMLRQEIPNLCVAGRYSPPFRRLSAEEDREMVDLINAARPDVVWVSLSEVKQDTWMHEHRVVLNAAVLVGVGAAFDFIGKIKKQAPVWMRERGLESLFRLMQEPRRLWRRYIIYGSEFVVLVTLEQLGLRKSR